MNRAHIRFKSTIAVCLCLIIALIDTAHARRYNTNWKARSAIRQHTTIATAERPVVEYASHTRGLMELAIANNGTFGTYGQDISDPFTGERIYSCTYPKNSNLVYLWVASFWIGAVVGRDTLVSTGVEDFYVNTEFWPEVKPFGDHQVSSIDVNSRYYDERARSEEDVYCEYTDTVTDPGLVDVDQIDGRPHVPLNVKVTQRSMAWSYAYADDFVLFDYKIENIGKQRLSDVYMGIWVDGDVWHTSRYGPEGWTDDIVGFLESHPAPEGCGFLDTVRVAYTADNDGDPDAGGWDYRSTRNVVGARVVRTPSDSLEYSYNWWIINYSDGARDFGPRKSGTPGDPFRDFGARLGTPEGDRNKYYIMSHREFDYDLLYTAIDHSDSGWQMPPQEAETFAHGYDTRYLLSFGPFDIDPGQRLPISFAWVGGADFHQDPTAFGRFDPLQRSSVDQYYRELNFADLALNARWASWVYDNPGRDTDDNGYAGKFRVCNHDSIIVAIDTLDDPPGFVDTSWQYTVADTFYYEGDGVPDFSGAGPPPAPKLRLIPGLGNLTVRFNGYFSETTKDAFIGEVDFEGYRVYIGLDDRIGSLSLQSSYDIEDYNRFVWKTVRGWTLEDTPFTVEELREMYDDPNFDPSEFTRERPLRINDSVFYFAPQDYNVYDLTMPGGIRKVYPDAPPPDPDSSLWTEDDLVEGYDRPLPKYYEYEYVLDNLLPTALYHVAVTAFDYGSPSAGLEALETNPINNMIAEYPQIPADSVEAHNLDAYVYPNPYRIDGNYAERGFENRDHSLYVERARRIHFANLPKVCQISIFSLDGDLVRSWDHDYPEGGPESMHDSWDLITRNTQAVVSGIYYYVIESEDRTQIGKFVIMK